MRTCHYWMMQVMLPAEQHMIAWQLADRLRCASVPQPKGWTGCCAATNFVASLLMLKVALMLPVHVHCCCCAAGFSHLILQVTFTSLITNRAVQRMIYLQADSVRKMAVSFMASSASSHSLTLDTWDVADVRVTCTCKCMGCSRTDHWWPNKVAE